MKTSANILLVLILLVSCKKQSEKKYCWQGFSPMGYVVPGMLICEKTSEEIQAEFPGYWFYKATEPTYCWTVATQSRSTYARHIPYQ